MTAGTSNTIIMHKAKRTRTLKRSKRLRIRWMLLRLNGPLTPTNVDIDIARNNKLLVAINATNESL